MQFHIVNNHSTVEQLNQENREKECYCVVRKKPIRREKTKPQVSWTATSQNTKNQPESAKKTANIQIFTTLSKITGLDKIFCNFVTILIILGYIILDPKSDLKR